MSVDTETGDVRFDGLEAFARARDAAEALERIVGAAEPRVLLVLGSGVEGLLPADIPAQMPFDDVPGLMAPGALGHPGVFAFGEVEGVPVLEMRGRLHLYEGHSPRTVVLGVRAARLLGAEMLIATNAAGAVAGALAEGSIMLISDHLNLTGANPLVGQNAEEFGERFPLMAGAYDADLAQLAREVAAERGIAIDEGVYGAVLGPSFETEAEVRMLATLGAHAVGMSTVPEVIAARHAGMRVMGFSIITNVAGDPAHGHADVVRVSRESSRDLGTLLAGILSRL